MTTEKITRIITEVTPDGTSVFANPSEPRQAAAAGLDIVNVWGTADGIPRLSRGAQEPQLFPFFPNPGGTRLVVVDFPPASADNVHTSTDEGNAEDPQPGLLEAFEADNPGMHTTDTIDYGICLSGELYLELDDGAERRIAPGTVVVQQGTRHAWRNRGSEVCTMAFVLIGAERA